MGHGRRIFKVDELQLQRREATSGEWLQKWQTGRMVMLFAVICLCEVRVLNKSMLYDYIAMSSIMPDRKHKQGIACWMAYNTQFDCSRRSTGQSEDGSTPVNHEISAVDVGAGAACKKHTNTIKLAHSSHSTHRVPAGPALSHFFQSITGIQDGVHVSGRDGVYANARARPLCSERRLKGHNRCLGDIVSRLRLREVDTVRRYRSREGDAAVWARVSGHMLCRCLRAEERARRVYIDGLAPLHVCHGDCGHAADDTGEAEQVVQRTQR